jgi:pyruvate/2-oxoglutarate dehydrogenase complex dihydrolipoamide dehydrogenase (E3) component
LASIGVRQGRDVSDFIFGKGKETKQEIPTSLWTIPEIATVGKTKDGLREMNIEPICGRAFHKKTARGAVNNTLTGWLELIALPESGELVGVQFFGAQACELIHYGAVLIQASAKINDIANAGYAAVTYHDLYHQAAEDAMSKSSKA